MQTFLPSKDFDTAANMLDSKRLNKQILECYQILKVLSNLSPTGGWRNHPAVKMWRGHESVLYRYTLSMVREAKQRGIKTDKNEANIAVLKEVAGGSWGTSMPSWYSNTETMRRITTTHQANLFHKDPIAYFAFEVATISEYNEPCCEGCKYFWVTHTERVAA
jgi:hypothetical protein